MGSFERFKTKTHFNQLKRLVARSAILVAVSPVLSVAPAAAGWDAICLPTGITAPR